MTDRQRLEQAVRRIDGELGRLTTPGVSLSGPGLLDRVRAYAETYRRQEPAHAAARREADRLLPELLLLYINGSDADRAWLRDLLREYRSFRAGFGWGMATRAAIATEEDARKALAVLSMKDGESDYRDQILAADHICAVLKDAGLPVAALLTEAAAWSSDAARFPPASSIRALLLARARRCAP